MARFVTCDMKEQGWSLSPCTQDILLPLEVSLGTREEQGHHWLLQERHSGRNSTPRHSEIKGPERWDHWGQHHRTQNVLHLSQTYMESCGSGSTGKEATQFYQASSFQVQYWTYKVVAQGDYVVIIRSYGIVEWHNVSVNLNHELTCILLLSTASQTQPVTETLFTVLNGKLCFLL